MEHHVGETPEDSNPYRYVAAPIERDANRHATHHFLWKTLAATAGFWMFVLTFAAFVHDLDRLDDLATDPVTWFLLASVLLGHLVICLVANRIVTDRLWLHIVAAAVGSFAALVLLDILDSPKPRFDRRFLTTAPQPIAIISITTAAVLFIISWIDRIATGLRSGGRPLKRSQKTHDSPSS